MNQAEAKEVVSFKKSYGSCLSFSRAVDDSFAKIALSTILSIVLSIQTVVEILTCTDTTLYTSGVGTSQRLGGPRSGAFPGIVREFCRAKILALH